MRKAGWEFVLIYVGVWLMVVLLITIFAVILAHA